MVQLSLDCLTLTNTRPADMIRAAAAAGFELVSLWLAHPAAFPLAELTAADAGECARLLEDSGVAVYSLEAFDLASEAAIASYRPAFELGARLGGKAALAYNNSIDDPAEVAGLLARFCETAAEFGLASNFEPVAIARTATLAQAREAIRASGADARILFDSWHLMRSGGGLAELRAIEPELIGYVQLNDGLLANPPEDIVAEVMGERLYPGTGEFPLVELLRQTPRHIPWGIEAPSLRRVAAGMSAADQARELKAAMGKLLANI